MDRVMDRIGLDTLHDCFKIINKGICVKTLAFLISRNEIGLKSHLKKGFYEYDNADKKIRENQALLEYLSKEQLTNSNLVFKNYFLTKNKLNVNEEELINFIIFPIINEVCIY